MEHPDGFAAQEREFSTRPSGEARPTDGSPGSFMPYHGPWFAGVAWGALLCAAYPLFILTPLAVFVIASPSSPRTVIAEIGVDCAVVAFAILGLQFVISARLRWVEAPFGLDLILRFQAFYVVGVVGLIGFAVWGVSLKKTAADAGPPQAAPERTIHSQAYTNEKDHF